MMFLIDIIAAIHYKAENIVRITGDCPLIDPQIVDKVLKSFSWKSMLPDCMENFRWFRLSGFQHQSNKNSLAKATLATDREHVGSTLNVQIHVYLDYVK